MPTPIIDPLEISELPELKVWEKAVEVLAWDSQTKTFVQTKVYH